MVSLDQIALASAGLCRQIFLIEVPIIILYGVAMAT